MSEIAARIEACGVDRHSTLERFEKIRRNTEALTANLTPEDQSIQSMPDVSPTKWHLAHTTWFFETFILTRLDAEYRVFDPAFAYLFNSYYEAAGPRHPRPERGLLSRPTVDIVAAYRDHVGAAMSRLIEHAAEPVWSEAAPLIELGVQHEQQHQELILMDIKHVFSRNPLLPGISGAAAARAANDGAAQLGRVRWRRARNRASRRGICLRQRDAAAQGLAGAVPACRAPGHLRRISRIYRRWRLCEAGILVVGRLGDGLRARLGGAPILAPRSRWRMVDIYPVWESPRRSRRAGLPRRLL